MLNNNIQDKILRRDVLKCVHRLLIYTFTAVEKDNRLQFLSNKSLKLVCYTVEMVLNSYTMDNEYEGFIVLEFR